MKIYYDPDEEGKLDFGKIPHISTPGLEALTGADFMVSPLSIPFTTATLKGHLKSGAVLVQQKRGHDYSASLVTSRLKDAIARMREHARKIQCVIQYVGTWDINGNGGLLLENHQTYGERPLTGETWFMEQAEIDGRGATFSHLQRGNQLEAWCTGYLRGIKKMLETPTIDVYPEKQSKSQFIEDAWVQDVRLVPDSFTILASFPYISVATVRKAFDYYGDNLPRWLADLTYPDPQDLDVKIFNKRQRDAAIRLMKLAPYERLDVVIDREELEQVLVDE